MARKREEAKPPTSTATVSDRLNDKGFRPNDFMRARHPDLFSDSATVPELPLTKDILGYHLDTLTSRKQEIEFEHFCRRLAEKELCPNLLPQTGPTGGGDSKSDAETYPVASQIAMRCYEGDPENSANERWAFAFSAKKKWHPKCISDVEKLAKTDRGYALIYFVSNQYIKDKTRSKVEDDLTRQHGIKVRLLDRTWIIKCVFEHDRLQLAVEALNLDLPAKEKRAVGPRDTRNAERLQELELQIEDPERYQGVAYQLVEDCLRAALLARNLELPRVEVEGRFVRAERIAKKLNHPQQQLRIAYNRAWTSYWWFQDLLEFTSSYDQTEHFAKSSEQADDLELLSNLWQILQTNCSLGNLDPSAVNLSQRTATLREALERLVKDTKRPTNSLWARTQLLLITLPSAAASHDGIQAYLEEFGKILRLTDRLIAYPFEPVVRIIEELGEWLPGTDEYDALLEQALSIAQKRKSQREAGRMLMARGFQKIRANQIYDAIKYFGRAQQMLAYRESRWQISEALFVCGLAYEAAGLLWAARANVLASLDQILRDYWEEGRLVPQTLNCARKLVWLELQIGRIPHVLEWMSLESGIAHAQALDGVERDKFIKEVTSQDSILGILFFRSRVDDLNKLRFLPDVLEKFDLELSRMALLYALGHEELLRKEGAIPESETPEQVSQLFTRWITQPSARDLPERLVGLGGRSTLVSHVLGCRFVADADDDDESLRFAERLLAAIEALLATSLKDAFPYREEFVVKVERSIRVQGLPQLKVDENFSSATVQHGGTFCSADDRADNWFVEIVANLVAHVVMIPELERYAKRVFGEESGISRAVNFTESATPTRNVLGHSPRFRMSDWNNEGHPRAFMVLRSNAWYEGLVSSKEDEVLRQPEGGTGDPPKEMLDRSAARHSDRRVSSLINIPLWEKAKWTSTAYIWSNWREEEPWIALAFQNKDAGMAIFRELIAKIGKRDEMDRLRVSIITGIQKESPFAYSVLISSNLVLAKDATRPQEVVSVFRINRMGPRNSFSIDTFKARLENTQKYLLLPAYGPDPNGKYTPFVELSIEKNSIRICPAWQIGEHDIDSMGISPDDEPIIPPDVVDAPILRLIERRKQRKL